jgi:hypothetical protein
MYAFFHKNPRVIFLFTTAPKLQDVSATKQARISTGMVAEMIVHGRTSSVKIVDLTARQLSPTDFLYSTTLEHFLGHFYARILFLLPHISASLRIKCIKGYRNVVSYSGIQMKSNITNLFLTGLQYAVRQPILDRIISLPV